MIIQRLALLLCLATSAPVSGMVGTSYEWVGATGGRRQDERSTSEGAKQGSQLTMKSKERASEAGEGERGSAGPSRPRAGEKAIFVKVALGARRGFDESYQAVRY